MATVDYTNGILQVDLIKVYFFWVLQQLTVDDVWRPHWQSSEATRRS